MSNIWGVSGRRSSPSVWPMTQRIPQVKQDRMSHSDFPAHSTQVGEVDWTQYLGPYPWLESGVDYMLIPPDLFTESTEEIRGTSDWHTPLSVNYLELQINVLKNHIKELTQENIELRNLVRELKPDSKEETFELNINWSHVRAVVEEAASRLNWSIEISINDTENLIIVSVPENQDDMIADTTFDYYSLIAEGLGKEVFRAINFYFTSDPA